MSFANLCMYSAAIPRYKSDKKEEKKKEEAAEGLEAFDSFFNE